MKRSFVKTVPVHSESATKALVSPHHATGEDLQHADDHSHPDPISEARNDNVVEGGESGAFYNNLFIIIFLL